MSAEVTKHWQAPDKIKIYKNAAFGYRWVRKEDVEMRKDEGWVLASKTDAANPEVNSIDGAAHFRGLILMKMPKHMISERNAHYTEKHNRRLRATAMGANLQDSARDLNKIVGGDAITTGIGETVIRRGAVGEDGLIHNETEHINPKDVDPADIQEMVSLKQEIASSNSKPAKGDGSSFKEGKRGK